MDHCAAAAAARPLTLDIATCRWLLEHLGPSLGLWRAAEVAALREVVLQPPVLDLGCGDGLVTSLVLRSVAVGLDPDPVPLSRAAQLGIYERLEQTRAENMSLAASSISTIMSNSVLEHIDPVEPVLRAVARVLVPGGRLVFTVPSAGFGRWLLFPFRPYAAWRNRQLQHHNLWPVDQWRGCLEQAGLVVETVRPYLRPSLVRCWDILELLQQVWIGRCRLFGLVWRRLPSPVLDRLARALSRLDLAAAGPSGGYLITARRE